MTQIALPPDGSPAWRTPSAQAAGLGVERCLEPANVAELAESLAAASASRQSLLVMGGGTRLRWANAAAPIPIGLSTLGLHGVDVFEPDEGVLHARAGTRVAEIDDLVREEGWELPLDPPGVASTVGGVVASAAAGPRAQGFGRVADAILGLELVGGEGDVSKCGGRVVKNVTGYDLAKLYCGSFGTLGVVTGAWLRLRPAPARRIALGAALPADPEAIETCRGLAELGSVRALVWVEGDAGDEEPGVYVELGGSESEVAHDHSELERRLAAKEIAADRIDALRDARSRSAAGAVVVRARVPGSACRSMVERCRATGLAISADLGVGVVHARGALEAPQPLVALREAATALGGVAIFEALPETWRSDVDVFGELPEAAAIAASLKRRLDPVGILNPGRFVAGT